MKNRRALAALAAAALVGAAGAAWTPGPLTGSCSTFALFHEDLRIVGHNLDDDIPVPGMVVVNKRGVAKETISWRALKSAFGRPESDPRIAWVSRYGSVTYNTFGKEFIDGGANEAGLYVGEMTLMATQWPESPSVNAYHHQWMQYLLDNHASVPEALASLEKVVPAGHCRWHFFLADRDGRTAVVEFLDGRTTVFTGDAMPVPVLCNSRYDRELKRLAEFEKSGERLEDLKGCEADPRFLRAEARLRGYAARPEPPAEFAFSLLSELDCGNNKWAVVFDLVGRRMYFRTSLARKRRFVDFASFDFSCATPTLALDIDRDLEGDVAKAFTSWTPEANREVLDRVFRGIDMGFFGNAFFKWRLKRKLHEAPLGFACAPPSKG